MPDFGSISTIGMALETAYQSVTTTPITLSATGDQFVKVDASGGARTVNLPPASTNSGLYYTILKSDSSANAVTIDGDSSETINGATTITLTIQYQTVILRCDGTGWFATYLSGIAGMTASSVDTLTNKTYDADATGNVLSNVENADIKASAGIVTTKLADSSNFVLTTRANTFGDFDNIFKDNRLRINNPADTFAYTIVGAAIAAARNVTLPLLTGNDTFVTEAFPQTLTNKTINGLDLNVNPKTASYTAVSTDDIIPCAPAANMTITLPAASTSTGYLYRIQKTNSNAFTVTIDANASELINGATTLVLTTQYQGVIIYCDGSAWFSTAFGSERTGSATGAANGSATVFNIAHGLGSAPYNSFVMISSVLGSTLNYSWTADTTNLIVTFASAPGAGTITFQWRAVL